MFLLIQYVNFENKQFRVMESFTDFVQLHEKSINEITEQIFDTL